MMSDIKESYQQMVEMAAWKDLEGMINAMYEQASMQLENDDVAIAQKAKVVRQTIRAIKDYVAAQLAVGGQT